jgi:hypothetical protein
MPERRRRFSPRWRGIGSGMARPAVSPIRVTRWSWRTSCAPTGMSIVGCPRTPSWHERSKPLPVNIKKPSGPVSRRRAGCGRCWRSSTHRRCSRFRISPTAPRRSSCTPHPTPQAAQRLTPRRVVALLKQAGRRNDTGLAERISTTLRAPALRQTLTTEHALGVAATGLIDIITAMSSAIDALERELADQFDQHTQAEIITSMPGLGPVLGARVLGELGDDPDRFADVRGVRSFAGTAPITRASGRSRVVSSRRVCNRRLGNPCHWWAFAALTKSPGARAHYDRRRACGVPEVGLNV